MEKKNKKKLFAIIGGSVLAFVLTIALSVSITLAYFGDTQTSTATNIKVGQALDVTAAGATAAAGTTLTNVLPGWTGTVNATGTVAETNTKYFLRFKFTTVAATDNPESVSATDIITVSGVKYDEATVTAHDDGYYYLATDGKANVLTAGGDHTFVVSFGVANTVKNSAAGASVDVTVTFEVVQADYLIDGELADGEATVAEVATAWENNAANIG